ncbi:MAG: hypothetical protein HWD61_14515 [Parachlamydiaceae bacterium]|nr:MAG: hypothetical protein HWD61_14515 [Parachlamydiaceae bacterium]
MNHQLAEIQKHLDVEKKDAVHEDTNAYSHLADALEVSNLQHAYVLGNAKLETEENVQQLIKRLNEERTKTEIAHKNLDELQQIYDQTVKLYNEIYSDHKFAQKQLETVQKDLDESKMNHLVELDSLEARMENLARELKNEQELTQELQARLTASKSEIETLRTFEKEKNDTNKIKNTSVSHLEALALQENL